MSEKENGREKSTTWLLPSVNQHREYVVSGRLVTAHEKAGVAPTETTSPASHASQTPSGGRSSRDFKLMGFPITRSGRAPERRTDLLEAPEILTLDELARRLPDGLDYMTIMDQLADLGPDGRVLLLSRDGQVLRSEVFEDPRICKDLERGAVIHNFEQKPADMSGWRVHEFTIDAKGCLGEVCARCLRVCPESAIHLRGDGSSSFLEIDPAACKGCYLCWVECSRKAADCILVDGKVYDTEMRARHFGQ